MADRVAAWRESGETVVLASGTFELLHAGHVRELIDARRRGTRLVVAVSGDRSSAARLGPGRPVVTARDRAALVAALRGVDCAVVFEEATVDALREALGPVVVVPVAEERAGGDLVARVRTRGGGGA